MSKGLLKLDNQWGFILRNKVVSMTIMGIYGMQLCDDAVDAAVRLFFVSSNPFHASYISFYGQMFKKVLAIVLSFILKFEDHGSNILLTIG